MDGKTMGGRLPARVALLALLFGLAGLFCIASALSPMSPDTPVALSWVLGGLGLVIAGSLVSAGDRLPVAAEHGSLVLFSVLLGLLASRSVTAAGIVGLGPVLICIGLYAAHFLPRQAARAHALLAIVAATLGALAATPGHFLLPWVIAVAATVVLTEAHARLNGRLRSQASTDPLTGVANRRAWEAEAARSLARSARTGEPLTVAILDLDGFKEVNDRDGHSAGDRLLRQVAGQWRSRVRATDLLGRHGGDEFVLCLPGTDGPGAVEVLQRLHGDLPIGWSVGTATARDGDSLDTLLQRADLESTRASGCAAARPAAESLAGSQLLHPGRGAVPDRRRGVRPADGGVPSLLRLLHRDRGLLRLPLDPAQLLVQLLTAVAQLVPALPRRGELLLGRLRRRGGVPGDRRGLLGVPPGLLPLALPPLLGRLPPRVGVRDARCCRLGGRPARSGAHGGGQRTAEVHRAQPAVGQRRGQSPGRQRLPRVRVDDRRPQRALHLLGHRGGHVVPLRVRQPAGLPGQRRDHLVALLPQLAELVPGEVGLRLPEQVAELAELGHLRGPAADQQVAHPRRCRRLRQRGDGLGQLLVGRLGPVPGTGARLDELVGRHAVELLGDLVQGVVVHPDILPSAQPSARTAAMTSASATRLCPLTKASQYGSAAAIPPTVGVKPGAAARGLTQTIRCASRRSRAIAVATSSGGSVAQPSDSTTTTAPRAIPRRPKTVRNSSMLPAIRVPPDQPVVTAAARASAASTSRPRQLPGQPGDPGGEHERLRGASATAPCSRVRNTRV